MYVMEEDGIMRALSDDIVHAHMLRLYVHDRETYIHSNRVAQDVVHVGIADGVENLEELLKAALLHDIGKIKVPKRILNKPDKLNFFEGMIMDWHAIAAYYELRDMKDTRVPKMVANTHRYNRRSTFPFSNEYMKKTLEPDVDRMVQIITVCDMLDALSHDRVYRKALPMDKVECAMRDRFTGDPEIVDKALRYVPHYLS